MPIKEIEHEDIYEGAGATEAKSIKSTPYGPTKLIRRAGARPYE